MSVSVSGAVRDGNRSALYLRVCADGVSVERQRSELKRIAEARGWVVKIEYLDASDSFVGRDKQSELKALLKNAKRGRYDRILVWSIDALAGSLSDLICNLRTIHKLKLDIYLYKQSLDTSSNWRKNESFRIVELFSSLERLLVRERIRSGMKRAQRKGIKLGRPIIDRDKEGQIQIYLNEGKGIHLTASLVGVGISAVQRIRTSMLNGAKTSPLQKRLGKAQSNS
jgi:DNA invertase Pin-like site-specific DNA recombinase